MSEFKFSCPNCGQHLAATPAWSGQHLKCPTCQTDLIVPPAPGAAASAAPVHLPPPPGAGPGSALSPAASPAPSAAGGARPTPVTAPRLQPAGAPGGKMSGLAIASFICGFVPCVGWLPAIICGHLALAHIKRGAAARGKVFAIIGLAFGYLAIVSGLVMAYWAYQTGRSVFDMMSHPQLVVSEEQGPGQGQVHIVARSGPGESKEAPGLTLRVSPDTSFPGQEAYHLRLESRGLGPSSWQTSGLNPLSFNFKSDDLTGKGDLRITSPGQVKITFTADGTKPFRLRLNGLTKMNVTVDGAPLDFGKPIPAGNRSIVVAGTVLGASATPNQR